MRARHALRALPMAMAVALGASTGCQLIVGSSDYAVGPESSSLDGSSDGTSGSSSGTTSSGGGTSSGASSSGGGSTGSHVGDPCSTSAQCPGGSTCQGTFCTQPCVSSAGCGANSVGQPNLCIMTAAGKACVPSCSTDADCSQYGNAMCKPVSTSSTTPSYCAPMPGAEGGVTSNPTGDPCTTSSDCSAPATCMTSIPWCTKTCASSADKSCGTNSLGQPSYCVQNINNEYICFPGCSNNIDCLSLSGTTCQPITSTPGSSSICAGTSGLIGDPCSSSSSSPWGSCTAADGGAGDCSNDLWCTATCSTDSDCGTNSAGQSGFCVTAQGGGNICFPGCTRYADCAPYDDGLTVTFCQQIPGGTRGFVCAGTNGDLGDPCLTDSDCTARSGLTCPYGWCTQSCSSASDTSCGTNSAGKTNRCILDSFTSHYMCDPGCTVATDCIPYAGATCQTMSGGAQVCAF